MGEDEEAPAILARRFRRISSGSEGLVGGGGSEEGLVVSSSPVLEGALCFGVGGVRRWERGLGNHPAPLSGLAKAAYPSSSLGAPPSPPPPPIPAHCRRLSPNPLMLVGGCVCVTTGSGARDSVRRMDRTVGAFGFHASEEFCVQPAARMKSEMYIRAIFMLENQSIDSLTLGRAVGRAVVN